MILLIDNYDSFTFNLYQYLAELGAEVLVRRNDEVSIDEIERMTPERIVVSPGPCTPAEAGISVEIYPALRRRDPDAGRVPGASVAGGRFRRRP